jgi:hypothetical protein
MLSRVAGYFSLSGPRPMLGAGEASNRDQVVLFIGVALGASAKVVYDALVGGGAINASAFVVALIASLVVFPQLHDTGGLNRKKLSFAHWALAFQNGFFWSVAFDQIAQQMSASG